MPRWHLNLVAKVPVPPVLMPLALAVALAPSQAVSELQRGMPLDRMTPPASLRGTCSSSDEAPVAALNSPTTQTLRKTRSARLAVLPRPPRVLHTSGSQPSIHRA